METIESLYDIYTASEKVKETSDIEIMTDNDWEYAINNVFFIVAQASIDLNSKYGSGIIGKINNGNFELLSLKIPNALIKKINPVNLTFSGKSKKLVSAGNRGRIKITKYSIKLKLAISKIDKKISATVSDVEEIKELPTENEEVFKILHDKPYLAGFAGIYNINIPIVAENSLALQKLQNDCGIKTEAIGITLNETFGRKFTLIDLNKKRFSTSVIPSTLGIKKAFYVYSDIPRNLFNFINKPTIILDNYEFENETVMTTIILKTAKEFNALKSVPDIATYVNTDFIDKHKEDISTLINSDPISQRDFETKTGINLNYLSNALSTFGKLMEKKISISNADYLRIITESEISISDEKTRNSFLVALIFANEFKKEEMKDFDSFKKLINEISTDKKNLINEENLISKMTENYTIDKKEAEDILEFLSGNAIISINHFDKNVVLNKIINKYFSD